MFILCLIVSPGILGNTVVFYYFMPLIRSFQLSLEISLLFCATTCYTVVVLGFLVLRPKLNTTLDGSPVVPCLLHLHYITVINWLYAVSPFTAYFFIFNVLWEGRKQVTESNNKVSVLKNVPQSNLRAVEEVASHSSHS